MILFCLAGYMNFLQRKIFVLTFVVFSVFSAVYAADENADDIFKNQKVEEGDFYKIVLEPSKKEIESENAEFFESVKQKKLDILKKIENERKKVSSAKSKLELAKENKRAELERNKAKLKNNPIKDEKAVKEEKPSASRPVAQAKTAEKSVVQKEMPKTQGKNTENRVPENKTVEESEKDMDSAIDMRKKFIDLGMGYKGISYVWGGKTPRPGFDCSGFVSYTAKQSLGIDVKGNAQDIYNQTSPVSLSEALPGDLIFFKGASDTRITHVGIYLGKNPGENDFGKQNLFLNAASGGPRTGVIISGLNENYWKKTFYGCGRILPEI